MLVRITRWSIEWGDSLGEKLRKRFESDGSNEAKVRIHAEFMSISDLIIDKSINDTSINPNHKGIFFSLGT